MQVIARAIEGKLNGRKLLLVVEDLDKIEDREQARKLFFEHRRQLLDIPCSIIFTFPIMLWYDSDRGVQDYDIRYLLPMIPVRAPPAAIDRAVPGKAAKGRAILREIVYARLEKQADLIASDALDHLIDKSGGVLRDLLYMLRECAISAEVGGRTRIERVDAEDVSRTLRGDYANRLAPPEAARAVMDDEDKKPEVGLGDIESALGEPGDWPQQLEVVRQTSAFKTLLQSLCILEYNGHRWFDLHPLVSEHLTVKKEALANRAQARPRESG